MFDHTYTDLNGVVHHESGSGLFGGGGTRYVYDPEKDPWVAVRRLMTCPHCGIIGRHREQGDPQKEYARLEAQLKYPLRCGSCDEWSIMGNMLGNNPRKYPQGLRVDCPPYRIPVQNTVDEEER